MLALRTTVVRLGPATRWCEVMKRLNVYSCGAIHCVQSIRPYSEKQKESSAVTEAKDDGGGRDISTATFPSVKEASKTVFNSGVVLLGVTLTGYTIWYVLKELFSSNSPNNIYSKALDRCLDDPRVQDILGQPIKGFGEETRRGRRQHVSYHKFQRDGSNYMWVQFYLKGSRKKGTVVLELKEDQNGKYQTELMVLQVDDFLQTRTVLEDNRSSLSLPTITET